MRHHIRIGFLGGTTAVLTAAMLVPSAAAIPSTPTPRYASPTGSGVACAQVAPCGIVEAINNAPIEDEVIIGAGTYGSAADPLTTKLTDEGTDSLHIHGIVGKKLPLIYDSASYAMTLTNDSSVDHLALVASGSTGGLLATSADHVAVESGPSTYGACGVNDLRESVCVSSGDTTSAFGLVASGGATVTLDHDTLVSSGTHSNAMLIENDASSGTLTATVSNTILDGTGHDLDAVAAVGATTTVALTNTVYRTRAPAIFGGGTVSVTANGTDPNQPPIFVDAAGNDFREAKTSVTVDAGAADPTPTTDLAGEPRDLGKAPDIGAFEYLPPPAIGKLTHVARHKHSIAATVTLRGKGLPTSVRLAARHHHKPRNGRAKVVSTTDGKVKIRISVAHLARHTSYRITGIASNDAGDVITATKTISTK